MDKGYYLVDSGNGKKLERIGGYYFIRPYAQAIWLPVKGKEIWSLAHAEFKGNLEGGNGRWVIKKDILKEFEVSYGGISFLCKLSDYGHIGIFFEQIENWHWLDRRVVQGGQYLNLFGYTGGSTLKIASKGGAVTHVDASSSALKWARKNSQLSGLKDRNIRWILDDALKFVKREEKRQRIYDGIILDPPTFGRGPKGEIWKIEKTLLPLLISCKNILNSSKGLLLLSAHSPGISHWTLENCVRDCFESKKICSGEMLVTENDTGRKVPHGFYTRIEP